MWHESQYFYIRAQRDLGAIKQNTYYAIAPFIGTFLSLLSSDRLTEVYFIGLIFMITGSVIVVYDTMLKIIFIIIYTTIVHTHITVQHT